MWKKEVKDPCPLLAWGQCVHINEYCKAWKPENCSFYGNKPSGNPRLAMDNYQCSICHQERDSSVPYFTNPLNPDDPDDRVCEECFTKGLAKALTRGPIQGDNEGSGNPKSAQS
jgi:hypothetical protein